MTEARKPNRAERRAAARHLHPTVRSIGFHVGRVTYGWAGPPTGRRIYWGTKRARHAYSSFKLEA